MTNGLLNWSWIYCSCGTWTSVLFIRHMDFCTGHGSTVHMTHRLLYYSYDTWTSVLAMDLLFIWHRDFCTFNMTRGLLHWSRSYFYMTHGPTVHVTHGLLYWSWIYCLYDTWLLYCSYDTCHGAGLLYWSWNCFSHNTWTYCSYDKLIYSMYCSYDPWV